MRYAIVSDIHGNLEALEAVLNEVEKFGNDALICLGDVVGYGPNPNECIEIIREKAVVTLAGNHDHAPLGKLDLSYFNPWAKDAIEWTAKQLTSASVDFLLGLPLRSEIDGFTLVHSTPEQPDEWNYLVTIGDAVKSFDNFTNQICFIGHSHVPMIVEMRADKQCRVIRSNSVKVDSDSRYIINVGSVGQPRDFIPRAACAIYDNSTATYELLRIDYEIAETQRKIIGAGLPSFLAERLELGQ